MNRTLTDLLSMEEEVMMNVNFREDRAARWFLNTIAKHGYKIYRPDGTKITCGSDIVLSTVEQFYVSPESRVISTSKSSRLYLRTVMPYHIDGGLILNREYKPIGVASRYEHWVDYDQYGQMHRVANPCDDVFFYHDGNAPWLSKRDLSDYVFRILCYFDPAISSWLNGGYDYEN